MCTSINIYLETRLHVDMYACIYNIWLIGQGHYDCQLWLMVGQAPKLFHNPAYVLHSVKSIF